MANFSVSAALPTSAPDSRQEQQQMNTGKFRGLRKMLSALSLVLYFYRSIYGLLHSSSLFFNKFLVNLLRIIPDSFYPKLQYPIEEEIISTTTRVTFTRSKYDLQQICLKLWQRYDEKVFKAGLVTRRVDYLLEGFEFNRRFAPDVYLGIAPVKVSKDPKRILRGKLIVQPDKTKLKEEVEYALVMRRLPSAWGLDKLLYQGKVSTAEGMKFLAKEVACMQKKLGKSLPGKGKPEGIAIKFALNRQLFEEALYSFASNSCPTGNCIENYGWIGNVMDRACKIYARYFEERYKNGHIKRCHGDLKATNLWVRPKSSLGGLKKNGQELIALDCVDFNPDFCHIDTLSDVAMLAIDIEMHLTSKADNSINARFGQKLAEHFLYTYLEEAKERSAAAWPLLEYYMTEKSMVCAYVSILYDERPVAGERYLKVALAHAEKLQKLLDDTELEYTPLLDKQQLLQDDHSR